MRAMAVWVVMTLVMLAPRTASAQATEDHSSRKLIKIAIGSAAIVVGAVVMAKSSQSNTVTTLVGQTETSSFSSSQLITGGAIAGAGVIVLWSGVKEHNSSPSIAIGMATGASQKALLFRKTW